MMRIYNSLLVLACCVLAVSLCSAAATARLLISNSDSDPIYSLTSDDLNTLFKQSDFSSVAWMSASEFSRFFAASPLGYGGFLVEMNNKESAMKLLVRGAPNCEKFLLSAMTGKKNIGQDKKYLSGKVLASIVEEIEKKPAQTFKTLVSEEVKKMIQANIYIRGADNVTEYDPNKWNRDSQVQYHNNCYNYGNDVRTDSFAQPGRGTGRKWDYNTCDNVWDAALRDGLIPFSRTNPPAWDEKPAKGHFIALVIWPDYNFHWYKKDLSGYWSHKPGQTAARDLDNSGKKIVDPAKCDRGGYKEFCGYLISVPSVMEIN